MLIRSLVFLVGCAAAHAPAVLACGSWQVRDHELGHGAHFLAHTAWVESPQGRRDVLWIEDDGTPASVRSRAVYGRGPPPADPTRAPLQLTFDSKRILADGKERGRFTLSRKPGPLRVSVVAEARVFDLTVAPAEPAAPGAAADGPPRFRVTATDGGRVVVEGDAEPVCAEGAAPDPAAASELIARRLALYLVWRGELRRAQGVGPAARELVLGERTQSGSLRDELTRLHDAQEAALAAQPLPTARGFHHVARSADGKRAAGLDHDAVSLLDPKNGEVLQQIALGERSTANRVALSADGARLAVAIRLPAPVIVAWDTATLRELFRTPIHAPDQVFRALAFSADGRGLLFSTFNVARRIDVATGAEDPQPGAFLSPVFGVAFRADGAQVATAGEDGVRVFGVGAGADAGRLVAEHRMPARHVAFGADGALYVADDRELVVLDARGARGATAPLRCGEHALGAARARLTCGAHTQIVERAEIVTGGQTVVLFAPSWTLPSLAPNTRATPLSETRAVIGGEREVRVVDRASGTTTLALATSHLPPLAIAASPDAKRALIGHYGGAVLVELAPSAAPVR